MKLLIIRHADPDYSIDSLTPKGWKEAEYLAERLGKIKVICPPRELQDSLVPFIKQVDKSKVVVQKSLDETQRLFDSLMQEYFS